VSVVWLSDRLSSVLVVLVLVFGVGVDVGVRINIGADVGDDDSLSVSGGIIVATVVDIIVHSVSSCCSVS
jgi:hypothetical protein